MRVALVTTSFPELGHDYIWAWARGLCDAGLDLTIYAEQVRYDLQSNSLFSDPDMWRRIRCFNNPRAPLTSVLRTLGPSLRGLTQLGALLSANHVGIYTTSRRTVWRKAFEYLPWVMQHFDVVHMNYPKLASRRLELGCLVGAPTVVSFRGQDLAHYPGLFGGVFEEASHLHFISKHLLREARSQGYTGNNHTLIPPMVDVDFFRPQDPSNGANRKSLPLTLFTAARLVWGKGWEYALKAVALLSERGHAVQYCIAGDGPFRDAVAYTARDLGIGDQVRLLGWLDPVDCRAWMQRSDVYILASVDEAFNNSVLQAQACGLPVVCTDAGGLPENIEDGVTGFLARRRDAWDLAEKLERLLCSGDLRLRMSRAARSRAMEKYQLKTIVKQFLGIYRELALPQRGKS
jgi:colanic acid/amylovoran biosynthesis glycosyltransferase